MFFMNNGIARGEVWGVELSEGFGVGREVIWRHPNEAMGRKSFLCVGRAPISSAPTRLLRDWRNRVGNG